MDAARIYRDKTVLVTGHTGFKGAWLCCYLQRLGAKVAGLALPPVGGMNLYDLLKLDDSLHSDIVDIREAETLARVLGEARPEIVFHLAAQPLVRRSYADPIETFATNILGTAHLMEACRTTPSVRAVVVVTTDKVYDNREWPWPYRETDPLGGLDPYSASKACAELVTAVYQKNIFQAERRIRVATARGGNVIGGGDWSEDRLVPDIVRAVGADLPITLRNPSAVRPWQHVLELCRGYLELGARLQEDDAGFEEAWNFGPWPGEELPVIDLARALLVALDRPDHALQVLPSPLHEAQLLQLDISKTVSRLGWRPRLRVAEALSWTASWYGAVHRDASCAREVTLRQIDDFEARVDAASSSAAG